MRQEGGKNLCTFTDPMSLNNRMMYPVSNLLLLGFSAKLVTNGAVYYKVLQNVIIGANFIGKIV